MARTEVVTITNMYDWLFTEEAYNIYKLCMYKPTYEAYRDKMNNYLNERDTRFLTCLFQEKAVGIIVLRLVDYGTAELMGIAVRREFQHKGIGSCMVRETAKKMNLHQITAETDHDAVGFYKKAGFTISKEVKQYPDGNVVRYKCLLIY